MSTRMRRSGVAVLSSIAVVAIAVGGVVAGRSIGGSGTTVQSAAAPSKGSAELQRHANDIFEQFNGTKTQRTDSGLLQAWALNGAMDGCMESQGFPAWDWSAGHRAAPRTNALDASLFFSAPLNNSFSQSLRDSTKFLKEEEKLRKSTLSPEEDKAVGECLNSTSNTSDTEASTASTPAGVTKLREQWWAMLASWQDKYADVEAYEACFAKAAAGLPINSTKGDGWKGGLSTMAPPPADIPPTGEGAVAGNAAWQGFVKTEKALESADWSCRSSTYEAHLADVSREIDSFAEEHAAEIDAAEIEWADLQERGKRLPSR